MSTIPSPSPPLSSTHGPTPTLQPHTRSLSHHHKPLQRRKGNVPPLRQSKSNSIPTPPRNNSRASSPSSLSDDSTQLYDPAEKRPPKQCRKNDIPKKLKKRDDSPPDDFSQIYSPDEGGSGNGEDETSDDSTMLHTPDEKTAPLPFSPNGRNVSSTNSPTTHKHARQRTIPVRGGKGGEGVKKGDDFKVGKLATRVEGSKKGGGVKTSAGGNGPAERSGEAVEEDSNTTPSGSQLPRSPKTPAPKKPQVINITTGRGEIGEDQEGVKLRLELNLDLDVELKASIKGDVTLVVLG